MENSIRGLFDQLSQNMKTGNNFLNFYANRLISELSILLNNNMINYKISDIVKDIEKLTIACKKLENDYINGINTLYIDIKGFIDYILKHGTNDLECSQRANEFSEQIMKFNGSISYEKVFNDVKLNITNLLDNQQLGYNIENIFNSNRSGLETEIIKIHNKNNVVFGQIIETVKGFYSFHEVNDIKKLNSDSHYNQSNLIINFLININNSKQSANKQKLEQIINNYVNNLGVSLMNDLKNIPSKQVIISEILDIFNLTANNEYMNFYKKVNEQFIPMLVGRTFQELPKNPKFEISRDSETYKQTKQFSSGNNIINLDVIFANIEKLLITKYELSSSNPKYMKIINFLNIKKAEMDNAIHRIEDNILIENIIEMQSQINKMVNNRSVTIQIKEKKVLQRGK